MLIQTLKTIRIPSGVRLILTPEQFGARGHMVQLDADSGEALVTHPMEFKAGEQLEVVGELPIAIHASAYDVLDADAEDEANAEGEKSAVSKRPPARKKSEKSDGGDQ